jgi:Protein of unknown function (DUF3072)
MNARPPGYTVDMESNTSSNESAADRPLGAPHPEGTAADGPQRDPDDWTTGDEPMTPAQRSYVDTLARQAGEELSPNLTKAEASQHIERLQEVTGRGSS